MTLRCGILTLKTSDSFFRSFRFLRQNETFSATEQNQTYHNSFFFRRPPTIIHNYSVRRYSHLEIFISMKTIAFWAISLFPQKTENQKFNIEENVMSERVKMPVRHFLRSDYLHIFFYIKFLVSVCLTFL